MTCTLDESVAVSNSPCSSYGRNYPHVMPVFCECKTLDETQGVSVCRAVNKEQSSSVSIAARQWAERP